MSNAIATIKPFMPRAENLQIRSLDDLMRIGQTFARTGYFQDARDASQCVAKIIAGAELGFGPMASMTGIHIIQGKPTMSANLIAAAIKRSGKYNFRVLDLTTTRCEIEFTENGEILTPASEFTIDDAKKAGLIEGGNKGSWAKYPRNMLFARALSNGAKWHCADIFGGPVYTPDEIGAIVDGESGDVIDIKPTPIDPKVELDEVIRETPEPVKTADEGWMIDASTRLRVFGLCQELEKLGVTEAQWRASMKEWTGVGSRRDLTGPKAAALMTKLATWITALRSAETRDTMQAEIASLIRTLRDKFVIDLQTIKSEMRRNAGGKEKRADLDEKETRAVRDAFALWIERLEKQQIDDEREAMTAESEML